MLAGTEVARESSGLDYGIYAYTAREWDPEINLYYYRARYYDSKLGRFISEDPIGLAGGVNLYSYVRGNPTTAIDPAGLQSMVPAVTTVPMQPCIVRVFVEVRPIGERTSWRYAHCLASCRSRRECGPSVTKMAQHGKEAADTAACVLTGNPNYCWSAQQPSDYQDNETGYSCPEDQDCEERCAPLKTAAEAPPGPYYDYQFDTFWRRMQRFFSGS